MTEHSHREKLSYNQIAGQSVERLAALCDGVFAVAMTLLVLDLRAPAAGLVHSEQDLRRALVALALALGSHLVRNDIPVHLSRAIQRSIVIAQPLYALGALLCFFNPHWSIALFILVQLNYVIALDSAGKGEE